MAGHEGEAGVAARYLLVDLPDGTDENELHTHFSDFGLLEEVSLKVHPQTGEVKASVKFANPTLELRKLMLHRKHVIRGAIITVQTWKMQKLARPSYQAGKGGCSPADGIIYTGGPIRPMPQTAAPCGSKGGTIRPMAAACGGKGGIIRPQPAGACGGKGPTIIRPLGTASGLKGGAIRPLLKTRSGGSELGPADNWYGKPVPAGPASYGPQRGGCAPVRASPYGDAGWGKAAGKGEGAGGWSKGWTLPTSPFGGQGAGAGGFKAVGKGWPEKEVTARFLLSGIPAHVQQQDLMNYFGTFAIVEEATLRPAGDSGELNGSVKFSNPTPDLRRMMLKEAHEIGGAPVLVQTWKMRKQARPGFYKGAGAAAKGELEMEDPDADAGT